MTTRATRNAVLLVGAILIPVAGWSEASWTALGPPGGDVREITADPRDARVVYLGTSDGALYRSDDGGDSWSRPEPGFPRRGASLDDIIVRPNGELLLGFWDVAGSGGGVARSLDGGRSVTFLPAIDGRSVRGLAVSPSHPSTLVAAALDGVLRSDDDGESWRPISPAGEEGLKNFGSVAIDPTDPDTIYAGTWRLSYKTTDGGASWRQTRAGMILDSDVMTLTIDRRAASRVYATACSGIYRSTDAAAHWSKIGGIPTSSRRTRAFAQDPRRPEVFYAGTTEGLFVSEDDTRTWRRVTESDIVVNAIEVLADGTLLIGCDAIGVLRSTDGGRTWSSATSGLLERAVRCAWYDARSSRLLAGVAGGRQRGGVWVADWPRGEWRQLGVGLESRDVLALARHGDGYLAGTDDGIWSLAPAAETWSALPVVGVGADPRPRVTDLVESSSGVMLVATPSGLLRTADGGDTWTHHVLGETRAVLALAASQTTLYAATPLGFFASRDQGQSWERLSAAPGDGRVRRLAVSPTDERLVLAATTRGMARTRDGGYTWRWTRSGLPRTDIVAVAIHADGQTAHAAEQVNGGIYESRDAGQTWERLSSAGLHSARIWSVSTGPQPGDLVVGAARGGLYRLGRSTSGGGTAIAADAPSPGGAASSAQ